MSSTDLTGLRQVLNRLQYFAGSTGAAAKLVGVAESTFRRWLRASDHTLARFAPPRVTALLNALATLDRGHTASVFVCHANDDKPRVRALCRRLRRDGVSVWFDEDQLIPGQDWQYEILRAVRQSSVVVACLSRKAVSKTGFVQKELRMALDASDHRPEGSVFVIPVLLEPCEVPERLRSFHWVDLYSTDGYESLLRVLRRHSHIPS